MATFTQLAFGNWRVQVRRKTRYVAETFRRRKGREEWALEMERNIDLNGSSKPPVVRNVRAFSDLIRERLIGFGRMRAKRGAGPAILSIELSSSAQSSRTPANEHGCRVHVMRIAQNCGDREESMSAIDAIDAPEILATRQAALSKTSLDHDRPRRIECITK